MGFLTAPVDLVIAGLLLLLPILEKWWKKKTAFCYPGRGGSSFGRRCPSGMGCDWASGNFGGFLSRGSAGWDGD